MHDLDGRGLEAARDSKHTPGPWSVDDSRHRTEIVGRPVWACSRFGEEGAWTIARVEDLDESAPSKGRMETEANARLIAAAPDLLVLANFLIDRLDDFERDPLQEDDPEYIIRQFQGHVAPAIESLRAAIAKAEGRS